MKSESRSKVQSALASALTALLLLATSPQAATAAIVLHDSFSDDTVGSRPNGAEVGTAVYPGLSVPASTTTDYRVIDDAGNQRLRVTAPGPAGGADNGSLIDYFPTAQAPITRVSYRFRLEAGASRAGLNAFGQELVMSPFGTNLELLWADDGRWWVGSTRTGDSTFDLFNTGFAYALDQDYEVEWLIDGTSGLFSVAIDGLSIVSNRAHVPMDGVLELAFFNNFNSTGAQVIDDVLITTTVPEPSTLALAGLAMGLAMARRARNKPPRAPGRPGASHR